jgi:hypothetical protein
MEYSHATQSFAGTIFTYFEEITMQHKFFGRVTETLVVAVTDSTKMQHC